ncbi:30S ribosomal protein S20 [Rubricoccus marinus]|uniref:Small ribosomal subunit protein bS20 n=1 Tax=Rubricoccus marinus TaxID=716817 RepID=A0A259TVT6_9BACT|nr:30S ribosomal protein S20 [Rubricoccus marinus]OZC01879.1 30S ribosomal protein S20 [Rubricoccus marinus]
MPQHKSAAKRVRQDARRRLRNRQHKLRVRTMMKDLEGLTDRAAAEAKLNDVKAQLDRMATRRIIHPNKAANIKSALEQHVQSID